MILYDIPKWIGIKILLNAAPIVSQSKFFKVKDKITVMYNALKLFI